MLLSFRVSVKMSTYSGSASIIGQFSRHRMKKTSPYATLLLDISQGLCQDDISQLKLLLQVDKCVRRIRIEKMKNGAEVLRAMDDVNLISANDTQFLEHLLIKIGRNDLYKKIEKYHMKRGLSDDSKAGLMNCSNGVVAHENTTPKQLMVSHRYDCHTGARLCQPGKNPMKSIENNSAQLKIEINDAKLHYTSLKIPNQSQNTLDNTGCKELHFSNTLSQLTLSDQNTYSGHLRGMPLQVMSHNRSCPDGQSVQEDHCCQGPRSCFTGLAQDGLGSSDNSSSNSSQSDVEMLSQKCSQSSQMSISDDEKLFLDF